MSEILYTDKAREDAMARLRELDLLARAGVERGWTMPSELGDYLIERAMALGEALGLDPQKVLEEELGES